MHKVCSTKIQCEGMIHIDKEGLHNHSMQNREKEIVRLYDAYYDLLVKYCANRIFCGQLLSAEDIVQETFIEAFRKWHELSNHENPLGWLMVTCRNKTLTALKTYQRRARHHSHHADEEIGSTIEDREGRIERVLEKQEAAQHLKEILSIFTGAENEIVQEHLENGKTIPEIAQEYGKSEGSYKSAMRRVRNKGRKYRERNFSLIIFIGVVSLWALRK